MIILRCGVCLLLLFLAGCPGSPPATATGGDGLTYKVLAVAGTPGSPASDTTVYFLAENKSGTQMVRLFEPADLAKIPPFTPKITDEFGNELAVNVGMHPAQQVGTMVINPGDFAIFAWPILKPIDKAKQLKINLPSLVMKHDSKVALAVDLKAASELKTFWPSTFGGLQETTKPILFASPDAITWFKNLADKRKNSGPGGGATTPAPGPDEMP